VIDRPHWPPHRSASRVIAQTTDDAPAPIVAVNKFAHMAGLYISGMDVNGT